MNVFIFKNKFKELSAMGTSVSRNEDLTENEILKRFVSKEAIPLDDADYWDTLLKYTLAMPKDRYDIR